MNRSEITLLTDETILWEQSKEKNLLGYWYVLLVSIIVVNLIIIFATVFLIARGLWWASIFLMCLMFLSPWVLYKINKSHSDKARKILKLSDAELKKYEFFDIFTNQRYIRRNYYLNFERYYKLYPEAAYELVGDIFFLELKFVSEVLLLSSKCKIGLELAGFEDIQGIPIRFYKKDISKFVALKETLITVLNLEYVEDGPRGIEIYRRNK